MGADCTRAVEGRDCEGQGGRLPSWFYFLFGQERPRGGEELAREGPMTAGWALQQGGTVRRGTKCRLCGCSLEPVGREEAPDSQSHRA